MRKVLLYSILLVAGLIGSQFKPAWSVTAVQLLTMASLAFIMVHVGLEFEIDRSRMRKYGWDALVASTAAVLPWMLCAAYFVFVMSPRALWAHPDLWRGVALEALFASPTSAGVLFSMLAAAGLGATWVFAKARVLAIFDDLATILLIIPLKIMMVGMRWQLIVVILAIAAMLWLAWRYLNKLRWPASWRWVCGYAIAITVACEALFYGSRLIDSTVPIQIEVLLPAFVLGCVIRSTQHGSACAEGEDLAPHDRTEQRVATIVSAAFMVLVGLSLPPLLASSSTAAPQDVPGALQFEGVPAPLIEAKDTRPTWSIVIAHVLAITLISNVGKLFPAICYRREATPRERIALAVGMFPRGEVGAGVLVVALGYGIAGPGVLVGVLSLSLNLLLTGVFIVIVKRLIAKTDGPLPVGMTAPG